MAKRKISVILACMLLFLFCILTGGALVDDQPPAERQPVQVPQVSAGRKLLIPLPHTEHTPLSEVVTTGLLPAAEQRVALTFDLGCLRERKVCLTPDDLQWPTENAISLLIILDHYGIKATFFPQGTWLEDYPLVGKEIVRRGHSVGNHSLTHINFGEIEYEQILHEIREANRIIKAVTGVQPYYYRPTYGYYTDFHRQLFMLEELPYTAMWSVDTQDSHPQGPWGPINPAYIMWRVLTYISDNGIILMHDYPVTLRTLPRLIPVLQGLGYSFVTLDEMLPPPPPPLQVTYTVRPGDTLEEIAARYGVEVDEIIRLNRPDWDLLVKTSLPTTALSIE